jgi:mono/diheme cytochrome c family protein
VRAVRDSITKDDRVLRFPMPQFRWADEVDLRAIYEYLKTVPHVSRPRPKDHEARPAATTETDPEKLFSALGCVGCHGPSAPFHDKIKRAASEEVDYLAKWIRDAPSLKPGVQMPTYARLLDEGRAKTLAGWVKKYAAAN